MMHPRTSAFSARSACSMTSRYHCEKSFFGSASRGMANGRKRGHLKLLMKGRQCEKDDKKGRCILQRPGPLRNPQYRPWLSCFSVSLRQDHLMLRRPACQKARINVLRRPFQRNAAQRHSIPRFLDALFVLLAAGPSGVNEEVPFLERRTNFFERRADAGFLPKAFLRGSEESGLHLF